jgi:VWFA-related protein
MPARHIVAACLVAAGCVMPVSTQERPVASASPARLVRTDLFATQDDRPVTDLTAADVQILEDGSPQTIESLTLRQPRTDADGLSVVVFVDTHHSILTGSSPARLTLARALETSMAGHGRVALTSPERLASELVFRPPSEAVSALAQPDWSWLRREGAAALDPKETLYDGCFSNRRGGAEIAEEMKARRRERATLDALDELVAHLDHADGPRTVVLVVSEGWRLFGEKESLIESRTSRSGVNAPFGRFGRGDRPPAPVSGVSQVECEADLRALARLDHTQRLRGLSDAANGALVTFLPVTGEALGAARQDGVGQAAARARDAQIDSLRFIADNTGGVALTVPNERGGLAARLDTEHNPYYLVAYRPASTSLDGRFRTWAARTTRPDVKLRVRRGYRGPTAEDLLSEREERRRGRETAATAVTAPGASPRRASFTIRTAAWAGPTGGSFWIVGELDSRLRRELVWTSNVKAEVTVLAADGSPVLTTTLDVPPSDSTFAVRVPDRGVAEPTEYAVRVRVYPEADTNVSLTDTARVAMSRAPRGLSEPLVWRRGPTTGPRFVQTTATGFQRQDRLRLEFATLSDGKPSARLVDRVGNPLQVPVSASIRPDAQDPALRWVVAELALAPLAAGSYEVELELTAGMRHSFQFSVVP